MSMSDVHYSAKTVEWETPQQFFNEVNREFGFTLDSCALPENAKCRRYFTPEQDGLLQEWRGVVWCNPPYGRQIKDWVQKASESVALGVTSVLLIPARTDTRYFHEFIWDTQKNQPKENVEIRFIKGRLKFGNATENAPFPNMLVIFKRDETITETACGNFQVGKTVTISNPSAHNSDRAGAEGEILRITNDSLGEYVLVRGFRFSRYCRASELSRRLPAARPARDAG